MFFKKRVIVKLSRVNKKIFYNNLLINYNNGVLSFNNNINLNLILHKDIQIVVKSNFIVLINKFHKTNINCLLGTYSSLINNIILGYNKKFFKKLILVGVGYKALLIYDILYLYLGYSHPIFYKIPNDIKFLVNNFNEIYLEGIDKQKVFQIASIIRGFKKPDIYKGKGIRYLNEIINFKEIKKK